MAGADEFVVVCSCTREFTDQEEAVAYGKHRLHVEEMVGLGEFDHAVKTSFWPGDRKELVDDGED